MTYFGYVERQAADQLDWSVVRRETDAILNKAIERDQAKRADIDKVSKDYVQQLESMDMSSDMSLNEWWLDAATSGSQAMLQLNKDLKDKRISYRDYIKKRQNLLDATSNMQNMVKEMGGYFEKAKEAYNSGNADEQTMYEMQLLEGYSKFNNTKWVINPTDYSGMLGKVQLNKETGTYDITDVESISSLGNRLKSIVAPVNVKKEIQAGVNVLGERVKSLKARGVLTFESIRQDKEFESAANNFINSLMVNPRQSGQVLTNYVKINPETGMAYEFTTDPNDKDPNKILLIRDPSNPNSGQLVPQLTKEQEKVAKDALMSELIIQLKEKETPTPIFAPTRQTKETKTGSDVKTYDDLFKEYGGLYTGQRFEEVLNYIRDVRGYNALGEKIISVTRTPSAVVFTVQNPQSGERETRQVDLKESTGKDIPMNKFLENISTFMDGKLKYEGTPSTNVVGPGEGERSQPNLSFDEFINDNRNAAVRRKYDKIPDFSVYISANNATELMNSMKNIMSSFPDKEMVKSLKFSRENTSDRGEVVKVKMPNGEVLVHEIFTGQRGKDLAQDFIKEIWDTLSGMESASVTQASPRPTNATQKVNYGNK
jgi:hypothetical protein